MAGAGGGESGVNHLLPAIFRAVETVAHAVTVMRSGRWISQAHDQALIDGLINGAAASIRTLNRSDALAQLEFLAHLPSGWLACFHAYPIDSVGMEKVLRSWPSMNYGLFVESPRIGSAVLKVAPTGSAFIGRLVSPDSGGKGLGKILAGLRPHSTISRKNDASLKSHQVIAEYQVITELPNDYLMIEFPRAKCDKGKSGGATNRR